MDTTNEQDFKSFLDSLRKEAFGIHAIWLESKKTASKVASFRNERGNNPESIEILQALVLFAANQPDLKFLIPYLDGEKSEKELSQSFKSMIEDEIEELSLYNNLHKAHIALYAYELTRNKKFQERLVNDTNCQKWIGE
jgi:hypothetical protein